MQWYSDRKTISADIEILLHTVWLVCYFHPSLLLSVAHSFLYNMTPPLVNSTPVPPIISRMQYAWSQILVYTGQNDVQNEKKISPDDQYSSTSSPRPHDLCDGHDQLKAAIQERAMPWPIFTLTTSPEMGGLQGQVSFQFLRRLRCLFRNTNLVLTNTYIKSIIIERLPLQSIWDTSWSALSPLPSAP